jgi:glutamyl-tRNA reductase
MATGTTWPSGRTSKNGTRVVSGWLVVAGTSHHVAPVALRERLAAAADDPAALEAAVEAQVGPAVVLATCNRLEVYCWTAQRGGGAAIARLLAHHSHVPLRTLRPYLYTHARTDAVTHLIRVTAGLDSLALGESQILGQVRTAWQSAAQRAPLPSELHTIFSRAIEAARSIRGASAFGHHPSVAGLAVQLAGDAAGGIAGRRAAVLGAGATGKLALQALLAAGATHVTLLNRSVERAERLVAQMGSAGRVAAGPLDDLPDVLRDVDLLICATAAAAPVVRHDVLAAAMAHRDGRTLAIADIAIPRDVDPAARELPGVSLIDLDDLEARCAVDAGGRQRELEQAEERARRAAEACVGALRLRLVGPDIAALRQHAEGIRQAELQRMAGRLRDLTPKEQAAVEQLTYTIVQKLLHAPTVALRRTAQQHPRRGTRERLAILSALSEGQRGRLVGPKPTADERG